MMKHIRIAFVFLFTLSLFLCVVPAATAASNSGTCGDNLTWSLSGTGRLTISGTGAMTDNTHPWLGRTVYSVVIGNGVTHIGNYAFDNMSELTSVTIPNTVTSIGKNAFSFTALTSVTIPASVTSIGEQAFCGCSSLTSAGPVGSGCSIEFGWTESIPDYAFSVSSIRSVVIPEGVTSIGEQAFEGCLGLVQINVPESVTSIGSGTFFQCASRSAGPIGSGCDYQFGWTDAIPDNAFTYCEKLTTITIPESVTGIGISAFYGCSSLSNIVIPESVTGIGNSAFYGCSSLSNIVIPDEVTSIGERAFYGCNGLTRIVIPGSVTSFGREVLSDCTNLTSLGSIGSGANIEIGWTDAIPEYAFYYNGCLKTVTIPSGVQSIGDHAFYQCSSLENVIIPEGTRTIGNNAFARCFALTSVTMPSTVTSIGDSAFNYCYTITGISLPEGLADIGDSAFFDCNKLADVTIPASVTSIGAAAFGRTSIQSVSIPSGITEIRDRTFMACNQLDHVMIPETVTSIGVEAFYACKISSLTVPGSVTNIGNGAFSNSSLVSLTIPSNVTSIGDKLFYSCKSLKSVTIPMGITAIGEKAFYSVDNLTDVYFGGTPEEWDSITVASGNTDLGLTRVAMHFKLPASGAWGSALTWTLDEAGTLTISGTGEIDSFTSGSGDAWRRYKKDIKTVVIEGNISSIGDCAFYDCSKLSEITVPESVTSIGNSVFNSYYTLKNVYFGGTQTEWNNIQKGTNNSGLTNANVSFAKATVTFDASNETENVAIAVTKGMKATMPADPVWENHRFLGWFAADEPEAFDFEETVIDNDLTLTAHWVVVCQISWLNDDGTLIDTTTVDYGAVPSHDDIIKEATAEYSYTFAGWSPELTAAEGEATYTAVFNATRNHYTVTFDTDGGEPVPPAQDIEYGSYSVQPDTIPEKTGNVFDGWELDGEPFLFSSTPVTGDITLSARWNPAEYMIVWQNENGAVIGTTTVKHGETPDYEAPLKQPDAQYTYTFDAWTPTPEPATGMAFYRASYTAVPREYAITIDNADPNGSITAPDHASFQELVTLTVIPAEGYEIENVYYDDGSTHDLLPDENGSCSFNMPAGNVTVGASFQPIRYTITWMNDDGSVIDTTTVEYGQVPVHDDIRKGTTDEFTFVFTGWNPEPVAVTGEASYTATFESIRNRYTVTFDTDGGAPIPEEQSVEYGSCSLQPDTNPKKDGHSFQGWYLGDTPFRFANTEITGDITLTAKWKANEYMIIWLNEDGTVIDTTSVMHGETPEHETPVKESDAQYKYHFAGWDPAPQPATGTAMYQASYSAELNSYTITWLNDDGSLLDTSTVEYGGTPMHSDPVKEATADSVFTFTGWTPELATVVGDATYTATFASLPRKFTLSYDANGGSGAPVQQTAVSGDTFVISSLSPVQEGWYFLGWAETADADRAEFIPGDSFTSETDVTLYAVWGKPDFVLPAALTTIDTEAFSGGMFSFVRLPERAVKICSNAFADCPNLKAIYISEETTEIASDAFGNIQGLTVIGRLGSYAETFAKANGFTFLVG